MDDADTLNRAAQGRLKSFVERLERLARDKAQVEADTKDVFAEAKGEGFDVTILKRVLKRRATDTAQLQETQSLEDLYFRAAS